MFLTSLTVRSRGAVIRQVLFRKGLNLIVDETTSVPTDSGNSVGKTTLLRCVDYCLGGDAVRIYSDPEFRNQKNETIFRFLSEENVSFELALQSQNRKLLVERTFGGVCRIDGQEVSLEGLREKLGHELFGLSGRKPSFRQLISKFIRTELHQISNTIKYLHPSTSAEEYVPVYLFLFGFRQQSLLDQRRGILSQIKGLKRRDAALSGLSKASLKEMVAVLDRDIERARTKVQRLEVKAIPLCQVG